MDLLQLLQGISMECWRLLGQDELPLVCSRLMRIEWALKVEALAGRRLAAQSAVFTGGSRSAMPSTCIQQFWLHVSARSSTMLPTSIGFGRLSLHLAAKLSGYSMLDSLCIHWPARSEVSWGLLAFLAANQKTVLQAYLRQKLSKVIKACKIYEKAELRNVKLGTMSSSWHCLASQVQKNLALKANCTWHTFTGDNWRGRWGSITLNVYTVAPKTSLCTESVKLETLCKLCLLLNLALAKSTWEGNTLLSKRECDIKAICWEAARVTLMLNVSIWDLLLWIL